MSGAVGSGDDPSDAPIGAAARVPGGERDGDDQSVGGKVLPRRENRADQPFRAGHNLSRPADQRQHQQPCLQLAGEVTQLADLTLVQRPAGGVREHLSPASSARTSAGAGATAGTARARAPGAR